ncbi:hypothetical protein JVX93_21545 [Mycolicibacterium boenickei]|nr:hypothetical protein JVX93_21545 [Mycolicibacterium boenickei]
MTRQFDDEPYAIRVLQRVDVAADALYHAAKSDDCRALVENLVGVYGQLGEVVAAQAREMKHYVQAERIALERAESAERLLSQADAENARLNALVQEFEAHRCGVDHG